MTFPLESGYIRSNVHFSHTSRHHDHCCLSSVERVGGGRVQVFK